MDYSRCTYISWAKYYESPEIKVECGDILLVKTGSSYGKAALVTTLPQPATINPQFVVIKYVGADNRFLNFVLQSNYGRKRYDTFVLGTAIPTFTQDALGNMLIPLPPMDEQRRIVDHVNNYFQIISSVDSNQRHIEDSILNTKAKILDLAIHGKLVPQDSSDEPAINILRRINPGFQPSHNLHYVECPSGWAVTQMKSIIDLLSGRDLENHRCNAKGDGMPYLVGASCINDGHISIYRWTETPEVISKKGDILLSCKGTVGEVVLNTLGNLHIARQFMAIRSKAPQYILPDYLEIVIKASIETLKKAARGIIPGISRKDILELTVMIPPIEEQQRILSRIAEFRQSISLISANTCNQVI